MVEIAAILKKKFLESDWNYAALAAECGVNKSSINLYFNGKQKSIGSERFLALCRALDFDMDTFIEQGGSLDVGEAAPGAEWLPVLGNVQAGPDADWGDSVQIGEGSGAQRGYNVPESMVQRRRKGSKMGCVSVQGDSMEPFLMEGDIVIVEQCLDLGAARKRDVVVVDLTGAGEYAIKRLTRFEEGGHRWLVSSNNKYDPILVRRAMRLFGIVVGVYRSMI